MLGIDHPYREHSEAAGIAIAVAQTFAGHCERAARSGTGSVEAGQEFNLNRLKTAAKAVEAAFLRGQSGYDPRTASDVFEKMNAQEERLQGHMPGRYIRENDPVRDRYDEGHAAMVEMEMLHDKARDLLQLSRLQKMPSGLKAVQTEMCWQIVELCERGADVLADAAKTG